MGLSIDEMKAVDRARGQLEQLSIQVANKEAIMKRDAANAALITFKTYFTNRDFALNSSDWNVSASHGSINFSIAIKNAAVGGIECLTLKFPEMVKKAPLSIFLEVQPGQTVDSAPAEASTARGPLEEVQEKLTLMRARLAEPPKKWQYFTLQATTSAGAAPQRKEYVSFNRLLEEECP